MMRKSLLLVPVLIGFLSACGEAPKMPERRPRPADAATQERDQIADPSLDGTVPAHEEQPASAEPAKEEIPAETTPPATSPTDLPAKLPATGAVAKAIDASLTGPELKKHQLYGFTWDITPATWDVNGNTVRIEGSFKHRVSWDFDDTIFYELVFEDGKLVKSDYFAKSRGSWLSLAAPIVAGVGMAYGIPLPLDAMVSVADKIEKLLDGNWEQAAQKIILRIGAEAYYRGLRQNIVGP